MKKLIPAFALLLISAVVLSTASYAWFSMNTTVTASDMQVTAVSDSLWLVIDKGEKTEFDEGYIAKDVTSTLKATLLPVRPKNGTTAFSATTVEAIETAGNWEYAYSNNKDSAVASTSFTAVSGNLLADNNADNKDYVAKEIFTVGLAPNSGSTEAKNLKLTSVTLGNPNAGITVIIAVKQDGKTVFVSKPIAESLSDGTEVMVATLEKDSPVYVYVYIYIDGDNTNVTTTNIENLKGTVAVSFGIDGTPVN